MAVDPEEKKAQILVIGLGAVGTIYSHILVGSDGYNAREAKDIEPDVVWTDRRRAANARLLQLLDQPTRRSSVSSQSRRLGKEGKA